MATDRALYANTIFAAMVGALAAPQPDLPPAGLAVMVPTQ